jgi:hypothetical protein
MAAPVVTHPAVTTAYAALTNQGFLLQETMAVAARLLQRASAKSIRREVMEEDLFQLRSIHSRKTILNAILDRLQGAPDDLLAFLSEGGLELRKLSNLYLILVKHRLMREFIAELLGEELQGFSRVLAAADINIFFERKRYQVPELEVWTEQTFQKSRSNITGVCVDAGLLSKGPKGSYEIHPQYVPSALRDALVRAGRSSFLPLLLDQGAP